MRRSTRPLRGIARWVHLGALALSILSCWHGSWAGVALLAAGLLMDFGLFKAKVYDDSTALLIKLVLLGLCTVTAWSSLSFSDHGVEGSGESMLQHKLVKIPHRNIRTHHTHTHTHLSQKSSSRKSSSSPQTSVKNGKAASAGLSSMPKESRALLDVVFEGAMLPVTDFPDLRYRSPTEVRAGMKRVFTELPSDGFIEKMKNPCWRAQIDSSKLTNARDQVIKKRQKKARIRRGLETADGEEEMVHDEIENVHCLPYAYILGQPKCGTSDLFERLKMHPQIKMPTRKEVRWFTRGEFTRSRLDMEMPGDIGGQSTGESLSHQLLGPGSSIYSFTKSFNNAVKAIVYNPKTHITIDGGPHTLWWPTQSPDGTLLEKPIPTPQIIRELQPNAKFIITLSDPVKRTYSDYYFLDDNLRVHKPGGKGDAGGSSGGKSSLNFHERVKEQIQGMNHCIQERIAALSANGGNSAANGEESLAVWFRASQICAHDRHRFAMAGWGRLAIGMYAEFFGKWLEHFPPSQFLFVRLEDYDKDPEAYMQRIFEFLGLSKPIASEWSSILNKPKANEYHARREPILPETELLLREFYKPHNKILSKLLNGDERYLWLDGSSSLHDSQVAVGNTGESSSSLSDSEASDKEAAISARKQKVVHEKQVKRAKEALVRKWHKNYDKTLETTDPDPVADKQKSFMSRLSDHRKMHGDKYLKNKAGNGDDNDDDDNDSVTAEVMKKGKNKKTSKNKKKNKNKMQLVNSETGEVIILTPRNMSLEGLPLPESEDFNLWLRDGKHIDRGTPFLDEEDAAEQLCLAAFGLDLAALKYLLYDEGVPGNLVNAKESHRNAFHCLALIHVMADAHGKSQVFATIKGQPNWLSSYIDPPLPKQSHTVLARDVVDGTAVAALKVAQWLIRADCAVDLADSGGNSPLHHAVAGGMLEFSKFLVSQGADPNRSNREGRTPLHYACAYGHAAVAEVLVKAGASLEKSDKFGTTPRQIVEGSGPILAADALKYLNITQRVARKINRRLHPELHPEEKWGWKGGTGGWGNSRIKGFEKDMHCEIDQYWAHEITGDDLFEKYLSRMAPVLVRGLLSDWEALHRYSRENLTAEHGQLRVQVSDIPYSEKFGSSQRQDMMLREYIESMGNQKILGGKHPWYVFKGNRVPVDSEKTDSLVQYSWTPTPHVIQHAIEYLNPPTARGYTGPRAREVFVNAQWAFGGEGTGAPVHYHNTAWNALVYGAKKWIMYPPHSMIMSNRQILEFMETDMLTLQERGVKSLSCVQTAGDVIIVPEIWGHGVLNLQESVAVATESKANHWRIKPASDIVSKLPSKLS